MIEILYSQIGHCIINWDFFFVFYSNRCHHHHHRHQNKLCKSTIVLFFQQLLYNGYTIVMNWSWWWLGLEVVEYEKNNNNNNKNLNCKSLKKMLTIFVWLATDHIRLMTKLYTDLYHCTVFYFISVWFFFFPMQISSAYITGFIQIS